MTIASGINVEVSYKKEVTWGVKPAAASAQRLRRETLGLDLKKSTFSSNEKLSHRQVSGVRHGTRSVTGSLAGELSPKTYADFMAAVLRRAFTAGASATGLTLTAAAAGKTFTRAAGSWLTDGFKVGDVVRFAGFTAGAAGNNSTNYRIGALTATVLTVASGTVADATSAASTSCSVTGKKTWAPASGHTNDSFSIEKYFSDLGKSETYTGVKVSDMQVSIPTEGMAKVKFSLMGKDVEPADALYFTSPTAETTTDGLSSGVGFIRFNSGDQAIVTSMDFTVSGNMSNTLAALTSSIADITQGKISVTGTMSLYFESTTVRDAFWNETAAALYVSLMSGTAAAADFINFVMPEVTLESSDKGDDDTGIIQNVKFSATYNAAGGSGTSSEATAISIQDSAA